VNHPSLSSIVEGVSSLRGLFVILMPDCLLYDSWLRESSSWVPEEVAAYFGDLVRANREGLRALSSWSADMQVTIESSDSLVILRELEGGFVVAFVYERSTPLGMVRLNTRKMLERLVLALPEAEVVERPRAVRLVEYLERYAPDPHAVLLRLSLQTGLPIEQLQRPEELGESDADNMEIGIRNILGLDTISY